MEAEDNKWCTVKNYLERIFSHGLPSIQIIKDLISHGVLSEMSLNLYFTYSLPNIGHNAQNIIYFRRKISLQAYLVKPHTEKN